MDYHRGSSFHRNACRTLYGGGYGCGADCREGSTRIVSSAVGNGKDSCILAVFRHNGEPGGILVFLLQVVLRVQRCNKDRCTSQGDGLLHTFNVHVLAEHHLNAIGVSGDALHLRRFSGYHGHVNLKLGRRHGEPAGILSVFDGSGYPAAVGNLVVVLGERYLPLALRYKPGVGAVCTGDLRIDLVVVGSIPFGRLVAVLIIHGGRHALQAVGGHCLIDIAGGVIDGT